MCSLHLSRVRHFGNFDDLAGLQTLHNTTSECNKSNLYSKVDEALFGVPLLISHQASYGQESAS